MSFWNWHLCHPVRFTQHCLKHFHFIFLIMYCTFIVGTHWHIVSENGFCLCGCRKEAGVSGSVVVLIFWVTNNLYQAKQKFRVVSHNLWIHCVLDVVTFTCRFSFIMSLSSSIGKFIMSSVWCDAGKSGKQIRKKHRYYPSSWETISAMASSEGLSIVNT